MIFQKDNIYSSCGSLYTALNLYGSSGDGLTAPPLEITKILPTDSRTAMTTTAEILLTMTSVTLAVFNEGVADGSASDSIQLLAGGTEIKVNKTKKFFVDLSIRTDRTGGSGVAIVFMFIQKVSTGVINEEEVLAAFMDRRNDTKHLQIGKFFDWNAGESYQIGCFRNQTGADTGTIISRSSSTAPFLPPTQSILTDPSTRLTIYEVG